MEIEYSNEVKGRVRCYRFTTEEEQAISRALVSEVKKLETQIRRIENDPRNEGQATYACKIDDLNSKKNDLLFIIETFK